MKRCKPFGCLAALVLIAVLLQAGRAHAQDAGGLRSGQQVALTVDALIGTGSVVSIIGTSVALGRGGAVPAGWLVSGYILGTMNLATGPLLLVYGRDPYPTLGWSLGVVHSVIGITNLAVAIYGAVVNKRMRQREGVLSRLSLQPIMGRDSSGRMFAGAGISLSRF